MLKLPEPVASVTVTARSQAAVPFLALAVTVAVPGFRAVSLAYWVGWSPSPLGSTVTTDSSEEVHSRFRSVA